jgi:TolB-like protein
MRRKGCPIVVLILALAVCEAQAAKVPIAVMDFEAVGVSAAEAGSVRTLFVGEVVKAGRFQVVERSQLEEVLKEQGLTMTGCTDAECAVTAGKLVGANYAAVGSVSSLAGYYVINVRVVGVEEGTAIAAATEKTRSHALSEAVKSLGDNIVADIPIRGEVIAVAAGADYVYADVGREDGLKVGMKGTIARRGGPIKRGDEVIGYETVDVASAEVTEIQSRGAELRVIDTYRAILESDEVIIDVKQYFQVFVDERKRREEKARKAEEKRLRAESRAFGSVAAGLSMYSTYAFPEDFPEEIKKEQVATLGAMVGYRWGPIEIAMSMMYDDLPYYVETDIEEGLTFFGSHVMYAPIFQSTLNPRAGLVGSMVWFGEGGTKESLRLGPKFDFGLRWGPTKNYELNFGAEWFLLDTADYFDLEFRFPVGFQYYMPNVD